VLVIHHHDGATERVAGPRRCYDALDALGESRAVLYTAGNLTQLRHCTGATAWEADVWRGRATAMRLAGTHCTVHSLRGTIEGDTAATELARCMEWLGACGVAAAGVSSMAWALWCRTLSEPLTITSHPGVGRAAFFGGRQEVRAKGPGRYKHMMSADITAAYATSMAARPYALRLTRVDPSTELDPSTAGLAEATVMVPGDMPFAPLPYRLGPEMITFPTGRVRGIWPWVELAAAEGLGCEVKVSRSWAPMTTADPFGAWWEVGQVGRALSGGAGKLAKAILNATWGMFGMAGDDRSVVRWTDDIGDTSVTVSLKALERMPHLRTAHIAAETAARVRTRMLTEALYGPGPAPVHIDTDGMIIRKSAPLPSPSGDAPGEWRIKKIMRAVEIRAPQCYRDQCWPACATCRLDGWHYVTAGMGNDAARGVFERLGRGTRFGIMGLDCVLPTRNLLEPELRRDDRAEVRALTGLAFGPGLGSI
jgi:hypothetical protein